MVLGNMFIFSRGIRELCFAVFAFNIRDVKAEILLEYEALRKA